jgi:hypothetical protein
MFPVVMVPESPREGLTPYCALFCRDAGCAHIGQYVTGLILSPDKTLQGIYALQVWEDSTHPSRHATHILRPTSDTGLEIYAICL